MIQFISLGGANEIGANSYYLNLGGRGILLDAGQHPRRRDDRMFPNVEYIKDRSIDSILVSHAHIDHIGALPFYLKLFPHLRPFMTVPTAYLSQIMLRNSYNLLKTEYSIELAHYDTTFVDMLFNVTKPYPYHEEFSLVPFQYPNEKPITCTFFEAGHILGSACSLIKYGDLKILYTGDICKANQTLIPGINLPEEKIDILIIESTSAEDISVKTDRRQMSKEFITAVSGILKSGGSVLIPVFALGKSQEILNILNKAMESNQLPRVDIYTGELHSRVSAVYDIFNYNIPRIEKGLSFKDIEQKSLNRNIQENDFLFTPGIALAPSGMVDKGTLSYELALRMIENEHHAIFFVGYTDPDSPGNAIKTSSAGSSLNSGKFPKELSVNAGINSYRFSAHAGFNDIIDIIMKINPGIVLPVHGSIEGQKRLKERLQELNFKGEIIIPTDGLMLELE
jgi:cleavage and polyadenylation specificity factor subunit 3